MNFAFAISSRMIGLRRSRFSSWRDHTTLHGLQKVNAASNAFACCTGFEALLHKRCVMKNPLLHQLGPMEPVVAPFDLRSEQQVVIPVVNGKTREEEPVALPTGAAQNGRDAVFETEILQQILQIR